MAEISKEETKLRELLAVALESYKGNDAAQRAIVTNVRQAIAEAQAANAPIGIDKPANGYSVQEIIDVSVNNVKAIMGSNAPKDEPPAPIVPDRTTEPPKPVEGQRLPSGAEIPPGIKPEEIQSVSITDPILLGDTAKVVEARERLKTKMMTSKQNTASMEALEGIVLDMNKVEVANQSGQ